ncbi:hypothetical protein [Pantoea sp. 1.19]|uniref:hypothetical protein n=1 Tax=Pantoea sp. 1.19 TaxID=1925589 RepID=UPI0009FB51A9|nr:hypothetical protein [Pantoea sp. 1.19]
MKIDQAKEIMPILIPDTSFNQILSPKVSNIDDTAQFIAAGTADYAVSGLTLPPGYRIVKAGGEAQYRVLTTTQPAETVYAVRLEFMRDLTWPETACVQVMVWRTRQPGHEPAVHGIARRFFCHFLETHAIIITDSAQTHAARVMWESLIAWALDTPGHHIYVHDSAQQPPLCQEITHWDDFYPRWANFCWGSDARSHLHRRIIISTHSLSD